MPREQLRQRLAELHEELERAESVDPESRALLQAVMSDIRQVLEESGEPDSDESLVDRMRDATHDFEESHPTLYTLVGRVVDTLANMGI